MGKYPRIQRFLKRDMMCAAKRLRLMMEIFCQCGKSRMLLKKSPDHPRISLRKISEFIKIKKK